MNDVTHKPMTSLKKARWRETERKSAGSGKRGRGGKVVVFGKGRGGKVVVLVVNVIIVS